MMAASAFLLFIPCAFPAPAIACVGLRAAPIPFAVDAISGHSPGHILLQRRRDEGNSLCVFNGSKVVSSFLPIRPGWRLISSTRRLECRDEFAYFNLGDKGVEKAKIIKSALASKNMKWSEMDHSFALTQGGSLVIFVQASNRQSKSLPTIGTERRFSPPRTLQDGQVAQNNIREMLVLIQPEKQKITILAQVYRREGELISYCADFARIATYDSKTVAVVVDGRVFFVKL